MTFTDVLKSLKLTDEQITQITSAMKENKIFTAGEENLDVRYGKLKADHDALVTKDTESQKLIQELQKATKDNEGIQSKIAGYESTIKQQAEELAKAKIESELKINLLSAGAKSSDIDYLIFKMSTDKEFKAELGDDGKIKGLDDKIKGLKTQFPNQFESLTEKKFEEKKLEDTNRDENKVTKEQFSKMGYKSKLELKQTNPDLYAELTK